MSNEEKIKIALNEIAVVLSHGGPPVSDEEVVEAWAKLYRLVHRLRDRLAEEPQCWPVPPAPGPEVTGIDCQCHGWWTPDGSGWWQLTKPLSPHMGPYRLPWDGLYNGHLPLVAASPLSEEKGVSGG